MIAALLLVFLVELSWGGHVPGPSDSALPGGCKELKNIYQECDQNHDCCQRPNYCGPDSYCINSPEPSNCIKSYEKCEIGGERCCKGNCTCLPDLPSCVVNNGKRGCTDLAFRKECPNKCGTPCEGRCITPIRPPSCKMEYQGCQIGKDQCCSRYICVEYCKEEDTICRRTDKSMCREKNVRRQCPRKCGVCGKCVKKSVIA